MTAKTSPPASKGRMRDIKKAIKKAKAGFGPIKRPKKREHNQEDITQRFIIGDKVCRKNAFRFSKNGQTHPSNNGKIYTVGEVDPTNRWFRVEGDTKWHNANKFTLLEKAQTELQKLVNRVLEKESAEPGDTDSKEIESPEGN